MLLFQRNSSIGPCRTYKQVTTKQLAPLTIKRRCYSIPLNGKNTLDHVNNVSLQRQSSNVKVAQQTSIGSSKSGVNSTSTNERIKIAVDVDEVLGRFVYTLNKYCKDHFNMHYKVEDYWVYEFAKIWQCTQEHSNHVVHEFFKSQHFNDGIPVIPGALETLLKLKDKYSLVVVTSRQHIIQDVTMEWLDRHFPNMFEVVYFGNHFALEGISRKKSDICKAIGAQILIDDNPSYAIECASAGINVLLYDWEGNYPWSKLPKGKEHELIEVVKDWDEVEKAIVSLSQEKLFVPAVLSSKVAH